MKGAPRVIGAQEFTRQLKNRVLAKSAPPAADQKFNTVATSILGNRTNKVIKLVSDPTKSCSGGWTDESGCCAYSSGASAVISFGEGTCACSAFATELGCPGPITLFPFSSPANVITITFAPGAFVGTAYGAFILTYPPVNFTNATAVIDGNPATVTDNFPFGGVITGSYTASSTIVLTLPQSVSELSAFCPSFEPP